MKLSLKLHEVNKEIIAFIDKIVADCGKAKHSYESSCAVPEELFAAMKEIVTPEEMEVAVFTDDKQTREENIRQVTAKTGQKHLLIMKNGWLFWVKPCTSIRKRPFVR